ncbi:DUF6597 domain-containing transcriptional factor [Micromonospora chokoriensis]|uniref:DUF6597 domain-containing transcriptional factor n=1 Tax=Micromonospora chokoriensis TaxID=356851 RepID=UPI003B2835A0
MRQRPRGDSRGILDPGRMLREVRFRRHLPAESIRPWVEHYWLIDWALSRPFEQRIVPHPAVNVVFQRDGSSNGDGSDRLESGEVAGVGLDLFRITLSGTGRVCGVQFRPGGFHAFWRRPVSELTGRRCPLAGWRHLRKWCARAPTTSAAGRWTPYSRAGHRSPTRWPGRPSGWPRRSVPTGRCCASTTSPRGTTCRCVGCSGSSWSTWESGRSG